MFCLAYLNNCSIISCKSKKEDFMTILYTNKNPYVHDKFGLSLTHYLHQPSSCRDHALQSTLPKIESVDWWIAIVMNTYRSCSIHDFQCNLLPFQLKLLGITLLHFINVITCIHPKISHIIQTCGIILKKQISNWRKHKQFIYLINKDSLHKLNCDSRLTHTTRAARKGEIIRGERKQR